jgi:hypothetical protein
MKSESVNRIMQAIDVEVQRAGFKDWDAAMEFTKTALNAPGGVVPFAVDGSSDRIVSRSELEKLYSNQPEPTQSELAHEIKQIKQLTGNLRRFLMQAVKKEIPGDPGGRHSIRGSPQEQKRRIQQVVSFIGKGMKITDALRRVARKENISLSSMQRIWTMRGAADSEEDINREN